MSISMKKDILFAIAIIVFSVCFFAFATAVTVYGLPQWCVVGPDPLPVESATESELRDAYYRGYNDGKIAGLQQADPYWGEAAGEGGKMLEFSGSY